MAALVPPDAYGIVEPGVHRANVLQPSNFAFVATLQLRKALILSPETPTKAVAAFLDENRIELIHLGMRAGRATSSWKPVSEELVKEGLQLVLDPANHPVLIMCTSGIHQTGTFVGCLRKLQGWNLNSIIVEYRAYAGSKARYLNEQYIELFDLDLVTLPKQLPLWLTRPLAVLRDDATAAGSSPDMNSTRGPKAVTLS